MEQVHTQIDMEEDETYGGISFNQPELDNNQIMVDTMRFMVAKLDDMSSRIEGLENSVTRADHTTVRGPSPAVSPPRQTQSQTQISSHSATQIPIITSTPQRTTSDVRIKPSEIKILELEALQRLDSAARLQMFFESVERCTSDSRTRLEVAKSRVDGDLAVMIHTAQSQGEIVVWNDCKAYLTREFGVEMNFDQAWRQSDSFHYDWLESPQSFVHKFKCHYAAIRGTFHNETLPDRDRLLKRKLLQGFPRSSRDLLEAFMDDKIPLNKFLGHVENERVMLMKTHAAVNAVPSSPVGNIPRPLSSSSSQSSVSLQSDPSTSIKPKDDLSEITAKLDQLQKQISQSSALRTRSSPRKFCAFCQTESHFLKDCWRKPEKGRCFDCLRYGCRRGIPTCPGKAARTPVTRPNDVGKTTPSPTNQSSVRYSTSSVGTNDVSVSDPTL